MSDYPHVIPRPAEAGEGSYVSLEDDGANGSITPRAPGIVLFVSYDASRLSASG